MRDAFGAFRRPWPARWNGAADTRPSPQLPRVSPACLCETLLLVTTSPHRLAPDMPHEENWFQSRIPDKAPCQSEPRNRSTLQWPRAKWIRVWEGADPPLPTQGAGLPLCLRLHRPMEHSRKHRLNVPHSPRLRGPRADTHGTQRQSPPGLHHSPACFTCCSHFCA